MRNERQAHDWLRRLSAAEQDIRLAKSVAHEVQRNFRPGGIHTAATTCRLACAHALQNPGRHQVDLTRAAIRSLQKTLQHWLDEDARSREHLAGPEQCNSKSDRKAAEPDSR
jgi:hypothetical protein